MRTRMIELRATRAGHEPPATSADRETLAPPRMSHMHAGQPKLIVGRFAPPRTTHVRAATKAHREAPRAARDEPLAPRDHS